MSKFLSKRKNYLQIALNSSLEEAQDIITSLPRNNRIIIEAGTPLIKQYGSRGINFVKETYRNHLLGLTNMKEVEILDPSKRLKKIFDLFAELKENKHQKEDQNIGEGREDEEETFYPYVVADLKTMDRGKTEVVLASQAGADAVIALGHAPIETLESFVKNCKELGLDSMIDMMNVENPVSILKSLRNRPDVVILHRGVDETEFNKEKQIPFQEIQRIKSSLDILIAIAGGDSVREVQRAIFNDADIVIVWKEFFQSSQETEELAKEFLNEIK